MSGRGQSIEQGDLFSVGNTNMDLWQQTSVINDVRARF